MSNEKTCTTDGQDFDPTLDPRGQQKNYKILCEEERAKGFVRPVRNAYIHVGIPGPKYPLRELTEREHEMYDEFGYVQYEKYPEGSSSLGRFWTQAQLDKIGKGCRVKTTMGQALSETYARNPRFYGATFCVGCGTHLPVGEDGEFVWEDGSRVGS